MPEIMVVTDSVAQIPPDMAERYHIGVIPFSIIIGGRSFKDGTDISPAELYHRMRTEIILPQTSHPSVGEYINFFKRYLDKDTRSILYFTLSEKLSGAFSTASKAAQMLEGEYPGKKIVPFDTGTATIAQGFFAIKAAQAVQDGEDIEHLLELAQETRAKVGFVAMLETLFYLERGGRIGKAAFLAGSLIKIKPVLTIDNEGLVTPISRIRGDKKYLEKLVNCLGDMIGDKVPQQISVMHTDEIEKAKRLKRLAQERFHLEDIFITDFTPVMGAHAGPGVIGLGYYLK